MLLSVSTLWTKFVTVCLLIILYSYLQGVHYWMYNLSCLLNPCCSMLAAVYTILYCLIKRSYCICFWHRLCHVLSGGEQKLSVCMLSTNPHQMHVVNLKSFSPFQELKQMACSFLPPDLNECLSDPCNVNANCANIPGSFTCTCIPGYTGDGLNCTSTAPVKK